MADWLEELRKYCIASLSSLSLSLSPPPLSLATGCEYIRTSFDPEAAGLKGLEWDSAELFRVSQSTLDDQVGSHDEWGDGFFI